MSFGSVFLIKHAHVRSSNNQMNLLSLSSLLLLGLIRIRSTPNTLLFKQERKNSPKKILSPPMSNYKKNRCLVFNPHLNRKRINHCTYLVCIFYALNQTPPFKCNFNAATFFFFVLLGCGAHKN